MLDDVVDERGAAVRRDGAHVGPAPGVHAALDPARVPADPGGRRELVERDVQRGRHRRAQRGSPREGKARGDERAGGPGRELHGHDAARDARGCKVADWERGSHRGGEHRPRVEAVPEPE